MKKKRLMKAAVVILALCILFGALAGCGAKEKVDQTITQTEVATETQPVKEEPLAINFLDLSSPKSEPESENVIYKWLKENKNIDIHRQGVTEKQEDRMNLILASGEIPDVVQALTSTTFNPIINKWADAGLIEPLDEWLAKYPDLLNQVDKEYMKYVYTNPKDGKNYMIPTNAASSETMMNPDVGPFIREDWLKVIGKEAPRTSDELYEVLKLFKEKIPNVDGKKIIPFNTTFLQGFAYTWTRNWYDLAKDGTSLSFMWIHPKMGDMLKFFNKLYLEGLIDNEIFTQKQEQYDEKLASGRIGYSLAVYASMDNANKVLKSQDPGKRYIPAPPLTVKDIGYGPVYQQYSPNNYEAITVSKKFASDKRNMERLMEYLKWAAGVDGYKLINYGPEGMYYDKTPEGLYKMKDEFAKELETANNTFYEKSGLGYYQMMVVYPTPSIAYKQRTEESGKMAEVWKEAWADSDLPMLLTQPGPIEQQKWGDMWAQYNGWMAKAIFAKSASECDNVVKEMVDAYEKNGGRDIINERLKTIQDFLAK